MMTEYESTWFKFRNSKLQELIDIEPHATDPPNTEQDMMENRDEDERILNEVHEFQIYEGDNRTQTPLTSGTYNPISASEIEYVPMLPEYPQTDPKGYAYVVNLQGLCMEEKKEAMQHVQYSHKRDGQNRDTWCTFLQCDVTKISSNCQGIKHCAYLSDSIRNLYHTKVDQELINKLLTAKKDTQGGRVLTNKQRMAVAFYDTIQRGFQNQTAYGKSDETCDFQLQKHRHLDITGSTISHIQCRNWTEDQRGDHFYKSLQWQRSNLDLDLLIDLLGKRKFPDTQEYCDTFHSHRSRALKCGTIHPSGRGDLIKSSPKCEVQFRAFIPKDPIKHPYAIWVSRGVHNHPPPPPSKPPFELIKGLSNLLARMRSPDLSLSFFLRSFELRAFCAKYGSLTISQLHHSFANREIFTTILQKQRALYYPLGREMGGIYHLLEKDPHAKEYIREIIDNERGTFIFCALDEQLQLLASLDSWEVDMSYKRVQGIFNEVIFATFLPDHGKIITLLRVFTTEETTAGYTTIFAAAFNLITRITGIPVQFHYLHGSGIKSIVVDMCPKQMTGLGKVLNDTQRQIDGRLLGWRWHARHILMFCKIHFLRTVNKLIPERADNSHHEARARLIALMECRSRDDYYTLGDLISENSPELAGWVRHKQIDVIAGGICGSLSLIDPRFYKETRSHTNAVEQSHYKAYRMGTRDSLLCAVLKSRVLDQTDVSQHFARTTFGIRHSYHADDMVTRFSNSVRREEAKRRNRYRPNNDKISDEDQELYGYNSSGYSHTIQRARSRTKSPRKSPRKSPKKPLNKAQVIVSPSLRMPSQLPIISEVIDLDTPTTDILSTPCPPRRGRLRSTSVQHRPATRSTYVQPFY